VNDIPGIDRLSAPERILLVEDLWNNIASYPSEVPIPESHLQELDRRLERHQADPGVLLSLAELQQKIEARK
jgi:putative addiction module component (TIGR02574 family)